eukprot:112593_1
MATDAKTLKQYFLNKFELWTKFMQSGKTKEMTDEIKKLAETSQDYFHIIFCSNNLFLTNQTQNRVDKTFTNDIDEVLIPFLKDKLKAIVFASSNKQCNKYEQLVKQFNNHRAILCCTNKTRFENISKLLIEQFDDNRNVIIWIDEVHSNYNLTLDFLTKISELKCIKKIIGISATPDILFKNKKINKTDSITLKPMKACDDNIYYGFGAINKIIIDFDNYVIPKVLRNEEYKNAKNNSDNALYLHTLLVNKKIVYTNLDVVYVPGNTFKISHEAIRDVLLLHGFYVFIFNSNGSYLYKTNNDKIDVSSNERTHLGQLMGVMRQKHKLTDKPIGITGFLSIGQGNTLCDWDTNFYITKSIIGYKSALKSNGECHAFITQVFGRCFGNIKTIKNFKGSHVFMKSKFAKEIEKCILSGALGQFALETGNNSISYNDLPDIKRRLKQMVFESDDIKYDILESKEYDDSSMHVPISFAISDHKVFDNLRKNAIVKKKKNVKKILYAYLIKREDNFGSSDKKEIAVKIMRESYKIDENCMYWMVDESDSEIMRKFEEIEKCERTLGTYPTPDEIKNSKRLWIVMDLRDAKGDTRCFALYS